MVADDNHATLWAAAKGASEAWIQTDLGRTKTVVRQEIRFEYPWKNYQFIIEISPDSKTWQTLADHRESGVSGSPVVIDFPAQTRFLRISFPALDKNTHPGIFEWIAR